MPLYVYEGPGTSLSISGRELRHGRPTALEGRAAAAAEAHPHIRSVEAAENAPTGLSRYAALKARAKELDIPATGKADDLEAAITAEEARRSAEADAG